MITFTVKIKCMELHSISTERLILKPVQKEDAPFILELLNTPKWLKYIGDRNVHTTEEASQYISEKMLPQFERLGFGNYVVIRKQDNIPVGTCGLYDREGLDGVDLGFAFLPEYENQGFGFEAATALKEKAMTEFGLSKLVAITLIENTNSQRLLYKLGFVRKETVRLPSSENDFYLFVFPDVQV